MILIVSSLSDDHTVAVLDRLVERGADVRLLDQSAFPTDLGLVAEYHSDGTHRYLLSDAEEEVDLSAVNAVWWRRPQPFGLHPDVTDPVDRQFVFTECSQAVTGLYHALDAVWMNEPTRDEVAGHKLYQLRVAGDVGLEIPRTHVTNDPASARTFVAEIGPSETVYKAFIAQPEAWRETRTLTEAEVAHLDDVALAPVIFQEYVPADADLRITVVGEEMFAVAIDASDTDYPTDYRMHLGESRVEVHDLPEDVQGRLRAFMDRLGLVYGAIDMRLTPDGRYVFLEVNPSGLWLFTEEPTGLPITETVVDWFLAHDEGVSGGHDETRAGDAVVTEAEDGGGDGDESGDGDGDRNAGESGVSEQERRREKRRTQGRRQRRDRRKE